MSHEAFSKKAESCPNAPHSYLKHFYVRFSTAFKIITFLARTRP